MNIAKSPAPQPMNPRAFARGRHVNAIVDALGSRMLSTKLIPFEGDSASIDMTLIRFGYSLAGDQCTIRPGTVRIHGTTSKATLAQETVTLAGATDAWVCVSWPSGGTASIVVSSADPDPVPGYILEPLYHFVRQSATSWALSEICHLGDVCIGSVLT